MDPDVFYSVVVPLLLIDETALLCISTVSGDADNFYSELLDMGEDGEESLIEQYRFYLACESCIKQGVGGTCKHKQDRVPSWQSSEKHNLVQKLYGHRTALHKQEAMGVKDSNDGQCFAKNYISRLYANPRYEFQDYHEPIRKIYVTIDPNAGTEDSRDKTGSDFALVSGFYVEYNEQFVITGLESIDAKNPRDYQNRIIEHIDRLREHPSTKNATIVLIVESNLGMSSGWINNYVMEKRGDNVVEMDDKVLKSGVATTHPVKKSMMQITRTFLEQDQLRFAKDLVCTGIDSLNDGKEFVMGELKRQLKVYQEFKQTPDNPLGKTRVGYTGKLGSGRKDDMCVALQLMLFWSHKFRHDQKYMKYFNI